MLRYIHPIEEHMDEAIASVRHDREIMFDEQSILQPAVKQKYSGHRNARYNNLDHLKQLKMNPFQQSFYSWK